MGLFSRSKPGERVLPGHSVREITDRKKKLGSELYAAAYLYRDETFILSAISDITEYGELSIFETDVSNDELGQTLCDKLIAYRTRRISASNPKARYEGWAAYQASGAKSGRAFEENSIFALVKTVNTAICIHASPRLSNHPELEALISLSNARAHTEIGAGLRRAIDAAKALRAAGLV